MTDHVVAGLQVPRQRHRRRKVVRNERVRHPRRAALNGRLADLGEPQAARAVYAGR